VRRIAPAPRFRGQTRVPGDKSLSHRLAILAASAEGRSRFTGLGTGRDVRSTIGCLRALGVEIAGDGDRVEVVGRGAAGLRAADAALDCGNSGSTMRMLAGVLAGCPFRSVLDGDTSLRARPMERVAAPLRAMGARVASRDGRAPLVIFGAALTGISFRPEVASAQVKTAVLLAGLLARGTTTVTEPSPTRDHTERLLPRFGVPVRRDGLAVSVEGPARLRPFDMDVPGDPSSAAFLVAAALVLPDARVRVTDVLLNPQRIAYLDVLRRMGGRVRAAVESDDVEPRGWIEAETSPLRGTQIGPVEVPALIDELPILAVAGVLASGPTSIAGAGELRGKESDRIATLAAGLRALGATVEERPDGLAIEGGATLRGATLRAHGDHRIAMALAVAALAAGGESVLEDAECAGVSYPGFFETIEALAR
jgi:3-phosphoshikimate 1-carboxyvinyltransferase